jgi:hypothetical protein
MQQPEMLGLPSVGGSVEGVGKGSAQERDAFVPLPVSMVAKRLGALPQLLGGVHAGMNDMRRGGRRFAGVPTRRFPRQATSPLIPAGSSQRAELTASTWFRRRKDTAAAQPVDVLSTS